MVSKRTYFWSNNNLDQVPFTPWRDIQFVNRRFILAEEDSDSTGDPFDTKKIVSVNEFNRNFPTESRIVRACWRVFLS